MKLFRKPKKGRIAGVCAGLADHLGASVFALRLGMIIFGLCSFGTAFLAYVVAWLLMEPVENGLYEG